MTKKSFKDNPALQFITAAKEETEKIQDELIPVQKTQPTAKAPEGYKPNPLYVEKKSRRLQLILQPSLFDRIKKCAEKEGVSVNEYVHKVLERSTKQEL